ncbi:MAG TPA: zinc ribbon domain-containing protein [Burkholderiales bacterium]|jgi:putative FmdB family regulatory protein|nr:zinc ribbon domain-containing protein [Burkholderiales bacterium]
MPIYEYRCTSCGFQKEYLKKITDPVMTVCPECDKETFSKMLTAAGFHLKGSGWYATDFKNPKPAAKSGGKDKSDAKTDAKTDAKPDAKPDAKSDAKPDAKSGAKTDTKSDGKSESKTKAVSSGAGPSS